MDIEALYSSIPHKQGVWTAGTFLMDQDRNTWPLNNIILKLLEFISTKNYFTYMDRIYLQTQSVAMDTYCAPSYANLFLEGWERTVFAD